MLPNYTPPRWLRNGHTNTIYSYLRPRRVRLPRAKDALLEIEPGVKLLLHCHWQPEPAPAIVLIHGLEGSSDAGYMLTTAQKALAQRWHVIRVNVRNCGNTEHHCATLYNSGLSGDAERILHWLFERPDVTSAALCGFSMGGNIVLKYAGEVGENAPARLRAAIAISACMDLAPSADALHRRQNYLYEQRFLRSLKRRILRKAKLQPGLYPIDRLRSIRSIREFDDVITAPAMGYRDADDYYARASASRVISKIRIPTLVIHAEDDPFVVVTHETRAKLRANPHVKFISCAFGGHCAFMLAPGNGEDPYWAENRAIEFCALQFEKHSRGGGEASQGQRSIFSCAATPGKIK